MTNQPRPENGSQLPETTKAAETAGSEAASELIFSGSNSNISVRHVSAGITGIILRPSARITGDDGARMRAEYQALTGGKPGGVLLQITGVGSVSREAISEDGSAAKVTALAVLGSTPVDRVIANRFLALSTPGCPTKYFTDEEEAITWLRTTG
jgi:hypothetical protein